MDDFNWNDIGDNMDWNTLKTKNQNMPNQKNIGENKEINKPGNFHQNNRGRGRGRGGSGEGFKTNSNPNYLPLGRPIDNSSNLNSNTNLENTISENNPGKFGSVNNNMSNLSDGSSSSNMKNEEEPDPDSFESTEVCTWADMKQFDDDHDNEWFNHEENKMAEIYGGKFIKVRYTSQGRVGYFCELCIAECNAKKSLDLHCGGMKHLKKKDLWEKEKKKPIDFENPIGPSPPLLNAPPKPKKQKKEWTTKTMPPMGPPKALYGESKPEIRGLLDLPYMLPPQKFNDKEENNINWYGSDRYLEPPLAAPRRGHSPSPPYGMHPSPSERRRMHSPGRRSPPYSRHGADPRNDRWRDHSPPVMGNRYGYSSRERSPPGGRYRIPSPPHFPKRSRSPSPSKKLNLAGSPAGALLQKLAECCVKTEGDADLALSVIGALAKSLKEYSYKNNEVKIAELLMEAELKIGTVKALKAGMKMLSSVSYNAVIAKSPQLYVEPSSSSETGLDSSGNFRPSYGSY